MYAGASGDAFTVKTDFGRAWGDSTALSSVSAQYRWKARKCRFLVSTTTEDKLARSLMFLAQEYEAAATAFEQTELALIEGLERQPLDL